MNRRALLASCATVSLAGCAGELTGRSDDRAVPAGELPTAIRARNREGGTRDIRVTVLDGDRAIFDEEWSFQAADRLEDVVTEPGTYTVEVETADGRHRRIEWLVRPPFGDVLVEFQHGDLSVVQSTECFPDCKPLSADVRGSLPFRDADDPRLHYPAVVHLESGGDGRAATKLDVRHDDEHVLTGSYEIPPDVRLEVGPFRSRGRYRVTVETGGDRATTEWYAVDGSSLLATIGDGVSLTCGPPRNDLGLYSDEAAPSKTVTVTASREETGEQVARQQFTVEPATDRTASNFLPGHGPFQLRARTGDGSTDEATIRTCPPWHDPKVALDEAGSVRIVQGRPV